VSTEVTSATQGPTLADQPKVFGLFSMVLFSVSAVLVADTVATSAANAVPSGTPKLTYWAVTGGGTIVSFIVGWWLYRHASRTSSRTKVALDAQAQRL
jgi:uncharacterized BrkB/YihY/UPF0761 family membrane protein